MIATGKFKPGERFPAVREMAAEAGVNPNTMQKALAELETEGYLVNNRTSNRSVTVSTEKIEAIKNTIASDAAAGFIERMATIDYEPYAAVIFLQNFVGQR
jgi:DNA-binding transcriptional regulator YhcF (GntR family)